jgi:hypothetical protein
VNKIARVSREIPPGRRPSQFNPPGAGVPTWEKVAGRLPLNGDRRMKPMLMVARRTDAGWFASGGAPDLSLAISLSATAGARMFPILIVIFNRSPCQSSAQPRFATVDTLEYTSGRKSESTLQQFAEESD